jgi:hypothetical protein
MLQSTYMCPSHVMSYHVMCPVYDQRSFGRAQFQHWHGPCSVCLPYAALLRRPATIECCASVSSTLTSSPCLSLVTDARAVHGQLADQLRAATSELRRLTSLLETRDREVASLKQAAQVARSQADASQLRLAQLGAAHEAAQVGRSTYWQRCFWCHLCGQRQPC